MKTSAEVLEFESLLRLVGRYVASPMGRRELEKLEPHTGRSHQLRVQCAKRGLPIVGDRTYGNFAANREFVKGGGARRMFLHSLEIGFDYAFRGRECAFSACAPLPPEFARPG